MSGRGERLLVSGDYLVTLGDPAVIADGAVIVENDRIAETGPRAVLEHHGPFSGKLGGTGYLLMPGFINAHYHSECWTARGLIGTIFEYSNLFMGAGAPVIDEDALELLATHVLETRSEMMWNLETHGKSAVRRLLDLGVLRDDMRGAGGGVRRPARPPGTPVPGGPAAAAIRRPVLPAEAVRRGAGA